MDATEVNCGCHRAQCCSAVGAGARGARGNGHRTRCTESAARSGSSVGNALRHRESRVERCGPAGRRSHMQSVGAPTGRSEPSPRHFHGAPPPPTRGGRSATRAIPPTTASRPRDAHAHRRIPLGWHDTKRRHRARACPTRCRPRPVAIGEPLLKAKGDVVGSVLRNLRTCTGGKGRLPTVGRVPSRRGCTSSRSREQYLPKRPTLRTHGPAGDGLQPSTSASPHRCRSTNSGSRPPPPSPTPRARRGRRRPDV